MYFRALGNNDIETTNKISELKSWAIEQYNSAKNETYTFSESPTKEFAFQAVKGGETVAALIVEQYRSPEFAFVSIAATLPEYKNKGYCCELLAMAESYMLEKDSQIIGIQCQKKHVDEDRPFWIKRGYTGKAFENDVTVHLVNINVID